MIKIKQRNSNRFDQNKSSNDILCLSGPSYQTKQLIQYLKSQSNKNLDQKLRNQIFLKKNPKPTSSPSRLNQIKSKEKPSKDLNRTHQNVLKKSSFLQKQNFIQRKGFFSPKVSKSIKQNKETLQNQQFSTQISSSSCPIIKSPFKINRETKFNRDLIMPQIELPFKKIERQCPTFLKKSTKVLPNKNNCIIQEKVKLDDFIILQKLGQGSFGQVIAVIHKITGSIFTIKKYKKQIIKTHQLQNKFIHDVKVQSKIQSPHIVKLYGFFDDSTYFYMIFQFMQSGNLSNFINQKGGKIGEISIYRKIFEINDALVHLHKQNIIHRDIKPASILTCLNVCKLCDTEWIQQSSNINNYFTLCKQVDYIPPEAFEGKQITPEFDIWGLGMIAYQLLTGKKLIEGKNQKDFIRKIINLKKQLIDCSIPQYCSQGLRRLILSTLEPVASKRLKSFEIDKLKYEKQIQLSSQFQISRKSFLNQKIQTNSQKFNGYDSLDSQKSAQILLAKKELKIQFSNFI